MYLNHTSKVTVNLSAAVTVDCGVSVLDMVDFATKADQFTRPVVLPRVALTAAADVDIIPASGVATDLRMVKEIILRNKHATSSVDTLVKILDSGAGPDGEEIKVTLRAGDTLEYHDNGVGWNLITSIGKLWRNLRVAGADYVNATTSFTDITGLTCPIEAGKHYNFEATIWHIENASTTGARFAINGPAMTAMRLGLLGGFAGAAGAGTMQTNIGDVTALDTAIVAATSSAATPQVVPAYISGWINPSAAGTFALRGASEIAVAAGLTVKQGSFLQIWEADA